MRVGRVIQTPPRWVVGLGESQRTMAAAHPISLEPTPTTPEVPGIKVEALAEVVWLPVRQPVVEVMAVRVDDPNSMEEPTAWVPTPYRAKLMARSMWMPCLRDPAGVQVPLAFGGTGGGAIKITAGGKLIVGKDIYANGGMGNSDSTNDAAKSGAGGSGGVVYLKANDLVINSGVSIRADGGPGAPLATGGNTGATDSGEPGSAAGGGGRVYLEGTNLFLNQGSLSNENLSANKGGEAAHSPFPSGISGLQLWLDASDAHHHAGSTMQPGRRVEMEIMPRNTTLQPS